MKKLIVGIVSLISFSALFTACLKNDNTNYPQPVDPKTEKPKIDSFIKAKGYNMLHEIVLKDASNQNVSTGIRYEVVGDNWGDTINFKPSLEKRNIKMKYTGTLLNGTVFDKTQDGSSRTLPLYVRHPSTGQDGFPGLVPGLFYVLEKVGKGAHVRVVIPSLYGYANRTDIQAIPANSPLFFDVEIVDVTAQ